MVKQKVVMKVPMEDSKERSKALRSAVGLPGVVSASLADGDEIAVVGDGIDSVALTITLRRRMGFAELLSVARMDEKKEDKKGTSGAASGQAVSHPTGAILPNQRIS